MKIRSFRLPLGAIAGAALAFGTAFAQDMPAIPVAADASAPAAANPPADGAAPAEAPAAQKLGNQQLDQLVAPVALYPDQLLSQILMASTYPLEVVEAARWVGVAANRALRGDALVTAVKAENWDPSVMALVPFPRVLELMDTKIEWARQLGDAFVAQQSDVMDSVQRLRHLAQAAGNLQTTAQCHCVVATKGDEITITAIDNGPVCVPVYNSRLVYGTWPYPDHPPVWFPAPVGFAFAPGFLIGFEPAIDIGLYGPLWGWSWIDWGPRTVALDPARFNAIAPVQRSFAGGVWRHDPSRDVARAAFHGGERAATGAAARVAGTRFGRPADPAAIGGPAMHNASAFHSAAAFRGGNAFHGAAGFHGAPAFHGGGGASHGGFHAAAAFHGSGGSAFRGGGGGHAHAAAVHGGGGGSHGGGHGDGHHH